LLRENAQAETPLVMACSALKASYRKILTGGLEGIAFVYMQGSYDLIQERLSTRKNHYMKAGMLQSQFDSLEEPQSALVVTIAASPQEIVQKVIDHYRLRAS
jgi:carbohydrate kinase (thermoresistant glucokinase family)